VKTAATEVSTDKSASVGESPEDTCGNQTPDRNPTGHAGQLSAQFLAIIPFVTLTCLARTVALNPLRAGRSEKPRPPRGKPQGIAHFRKFSSIGSPASHALPSPKSRPASGLRKPGMSVFTGNPSPACKYARCFRAGLTSVYSSSAPGTSSYPPFRRTTNNPPAIIDPFLIAVDDGV
jgi:hypothetical protein